MEDFIDVLETVTNSITGLGVPVLLPIIILIISLIFRQTFRKSLIAALTFGAAFIGLNLVIGLLIDTITPVTQAMVEMTGVEKDIIDVGWPAASAIAFSTVAGALVIPCSLVVNFIMLALKWTKTINVDIWNFWFHAFTASVVYIASGQLWLALVASSLQAAFCLFIADRTAKRVQDFYGLPGVSIPQAFAVSTVPIIIGVNWVIDRIPGVRNIVWDEKHIRERWGIIGSPLVLGCILGLGLGLAGGLWNDPAQLAMVAITVGAVMLLLPKIIGLFMESLTTVSEAASTFFQRRFKGREIFIGLDSALLIGHPVTVAAAVILIPITLVIAIALPFNRVLPFGDLAACAYFVAMVPCLSRGNLFRSIITGAVMVTIILLVCTAFGSSLTDMAIAANYELPDGAVDITALSAGNWVSLLFYEIGELLPFN